MSQQRYPLDGDRSTKELIAQRLRFWIDRRKYASDELFAHECGIHKGNVSKFLRALSMPDLMTLLKMADVLEISIDDLLIETPLYLAEKQLSYEEEQQGEWK